MISAEQQKLVQESFSRIFQHKAHVGALCYEHFFARCPDARALFSEGFSQQHQMMVTELTLIVRAVGQDTPLPQVVRLARMHGSHGVRADHFPAMRAALLHGLSTVMESDFTPELAAAWAAAFDHLADQMIPAA